MFAWLKGKYDALYTDEDAREKFAGRISKLSMVVSLVFVMYLGGCWLPFGLAGTIIPIFVYKAIISAFSNEPMTFSIFDDEQ